MTLLFRITGCLPLMLVDSIAGMALTLHSVLKIIFILTSNILFIKTA